MDRDTSDFAFAAAVNDRQILASCLARSPDIASGSSPLKTYEGYASAARALNQAIDESTAPIVIFVHQDVYLPHGWLQKLIAQIAILEQEHSAWGVLGLYGRQVSGEEVGLVWSSGLGRVVGHGGFRPTKAVTLDELLLVLRRDSGLRFDEAIPGFHLYGTDIVVDAGTKGIPSFVVDAPAVHNSRPVRTLTGPYAQAYRYLQRKWRKQLPIKNLSSDIVWHPVKLWRAQVQSIRLYKRNIQRPRYDAVEIAKELRFE